MSTLQPCQIGVIILSLIVLVQTGLLVGALVKIVLLTKKGETFCKTVQQYPNYVITPTQDQSRRQEKRGWRWMSMWLMVLLKRSWHVGQANKPKSTGLLHTRKQCSCMPTNRSVYTHTHEAVGHTQRACAKMWRSRIDRAREKLVDAPTAPHYSGSQHHDHMYHAHIWGASGKRWWNSTCHEPSWRFVTTLCWYAGSGGAVVSP